MTTSKPDRDRIRQSAKAKQIKRELILASKARNAITEYLHGRNPVACMEDLKQAAKG